jgi:hypothetical protein
VVQRIDNTGAPGGPRIVVIDIVLTLRLRRTDFG